jgi:hypothetical protein
VVWEGKLKRTPKPATPKGTSIEKNTLRKSVQKIHGKRDFFFHMSAQKGEGMIRTSDFCFIKRNPNQLSYFLIKEILSFELENHSQDDRDMAKDASLYQRPNSYTCRKPFKRIKQHHNCRFSEI